MSAPNILVVEDDRELSDLVSKRLSDSGYAVHVADTGSKALEYLESDTPDLVLLDIMLPEMDGLEVCRRIRSSHPLMYVIMLTARISEMDRVVGLEVGADDYVTKPFSLDELIARVRSALRRIRLTQENQGAPAPDEEVPLDYGSIFIDPMRREVKLNGELLHLTVREYDLLLFMARSPGRPFSRMQLLEKVWDIHYEGYDRTVDSHIQRLRAKVEGDPGNPEYIRTVWGVGYKFECDTVEA